MHVRWLSWDDQEAEVLVSDGTFQLNCFAHPNQYSGGEIVTQPLQALDARNVQVVRDQPYGIEEYVYPSGFLVVGLVNNKKTTPSLLAALKSS